ncbi:MAG: DNA recombination protein RmuC [Desulfobacterales bacterium]|nr:DNA recombination protein RmuC [Desulfobacterales bacterium]
MMPMDIITISIFAAGGAIGFALAWFMAKTRFSKTLMAISNENAAASARLESLAGLEEEIKIGRTEIEALNEKISDLKAVHARLEAVNEEERKAADEKLAMLGEVRESLTDAYKALSANALRENNQSFLDLAKTTLSNYLESARQDFDSRDKAIKEVVSPVKDVLEKYDRHVQEMEKARENAYGSLTQQVISLAKSQDILQSETGKLVKALRVPHVRGRWGEITLRRVAELSGMQNRCDFFEQFTGSGEDGRMRPDMIVSLPGGRQIIVDAKVPISAYLDALEAETEEQKEERLHAHARHVRTHIQQLSLKSYWTQFKPTPEFVVLFIPGENFFSAALTQDPSLIENGVNKGVVLATPTTLISLLKTVAFGWQQETATENAKAISELGRELYDRICLMANHLGQLGKDIEKCTGTYNKLIGSFERRVMVSARKFSELGIPLKDNKTLEAIEQVEVKARTVAEINGNSDDEQ